MHYGVLRFLPLDSGSKIYEFFSSIYISPYGTYRKKEATLQNSWQEQLNSYVTPH